MIKVILWDLDGVLANLVSIHYRALNKALLRVSGFKISSNEEERFNGLPTNTKLDILIKENKISENDKEKIWRLKQDLTREVILETLNLDKDKIEMHERIKELGLKEACVTNSIRQTVLLALKQTGQLNFMEHIISNEDVRKPKPDPEGYLKAMDLFDVRCDEVLICEDSFKGIEAAKAADAHIWHVKNCSEVKLDNLTEVLNGTKS